MACWVTVELAVAVVAVTVAVQSLVLVVVLAPSYTVLAVGSVTVLLAVTSKPYLVTVKVAVVVPG